MNNMLGKDYHCCLLSTDKMKVSTITRDKVFFETKLSEEGISADVALDLESVRGLIEQLKSVLEEYDG